MSEEEESGREKEKYDLWKKQMLEAGWILLPNGCWVMKNLWSNTKS